MKIVSTEFSSVFEIKNKIFKDNRGLFVKTYHFDIFKEYGLEIDFKESFYSVSKKGVLRGMHFQLPPYEHAKLVYVVDGKILDVVVDIRKNSETFGKYYTTELSEENANSLYVGKGFAHGFLTLSNDAKVVYLTTTVHYPEFDAGIRWNSFGFDWGEADIIMSDRDKVFPHLDEL